MQQDFSFALLVTLFVWLSFCPGVNTDTCPTGSPYCSFATRPCLETTNTVQEQLPNGETYSDLNSWITDVLANGSAVYPNVNARWVNTSNDPNLYFVNTGASCAVNVTFVYETASYRPKLSYFSFNRTTSQQITNAVLIFNETSVDCQANNRSCLEPGSTVTIGPFDADVGVGFILTRDLNCTPTWVSLYSLDAMNVNRTGWLGYTTTGRVIAAFKDPNTKRITHGWEDGPRIDYDYNDRLFSFTATCELDESLIPCDEGCRDPTQVFDAAKCECNDPAPSPSPSPSASPIPPPLVLQSNASDIAPEMPLLVLNLTAPVLNIVPRDETGTAQQESSVSLGLTYVKEIDDRDPSSPVLAATFVQGGWKQVAADVELGSSQTFVFSAKLAFENASNGMLVTPQEDNSTQSRLEMQLDLFERDTPVSLAGLVNFTITTSFTKLSLRLWDWPWTAEDAHHRVEVRIGITPSVTNVVSAEDIGGGVTEYTMTNINDGGETIKIRLVDVAEMDGQTVDSVPFAASGESGPAVTFEIDETQSVLVLSFAFFNSTLAYDPDVGVLLGAANGASSSSATWIVAVAVAVPAVVALALLLGVGIAVLVHVRRKRTRKAINKRLQAMSETNRL